MRIIGVTGGIATGKSTLCNWFRKHTSYPVIDSDKITHSILDTDATARRRLLSKFGKDIFTNSSCGEIDRKALGKIIFANPNKKRLLESVIHPMVLQKISILILSYFLKGYDYIVVEVPLLFELHLEFLFSEIIVVKCSPETQLKRVLFRRPDLTQEEASKIIHSQIPLEQKCQLAHWVIVSDSEEPFADDPSFAQVSSLYRNILYPRPLVSIFWLLFTYCITIILFYKCIY